MQILKNTILQRKKNQYIIPSPNITFMFWIHWRFFRTMKCFRKWFRIDSYTIRSENKKKVIIYIIYLYIPITYIVCGTRLCIKSSLLCEPVSLWVSRRVVMRFVHTTGMTWYKVLYKHTMFVISLSNISIKTNFKQITSVEIRLTNVYNTLRETTICAWRHVYLLPFILLLFSCCSHWCVLPAYQ